ncbi:esterase/lipase family protein [Anaerosacchariphilus polymeriproducens]|uniref:Alpha/beta fold hydrolase n=1 Tax=Anaerosacchariphilus polymeriproducens TaxID=1812858 RepID=A0A371AW73_9FIRM|nr:alpha/beta fold hydrolase [Anaerosacchariphilus polymeriproducens]RDU23789.1 alpha/beta fold hydrolase [Anaerosacchariphilus polymeriproducens]
MKKLKKLIIFAVLLSVFTFNSTIFASAASNKNPVIMVHGLGGSSTNFYMIQNYLVSKGWSRDQMTAVVLPTKTGDNILNSRAISNAVDKLLAQTGASKVDIIAHSMGGANSLYYITKMNGAQKVDKLVTLGGANRLVTSSAPSGVDVTSITGTADMIVASSLSKLNGANNISVPGVTHIGLLSNSKVNSLIEKALLNSESNQGSGSSDSNSGWNWPYFNWFSSK